MAAKLLLEVPEDMNVKLLQLKQKTGLTKAAIARAAIMEYIEKRHENGNFVSGLGGGS